MPRNSPGNISRAEMISRLSSCKSGSLSRRNSKKCTWSIRPSQMPQASPAGHSGYMPRGRSPRPARAAPLLQASHRAGHCHPGNSTRSDTTSAPAVAPDRRRRPQAPPHSAGPAIATRCGQAGNQGGTLSARQRREAWNVEFVQGLTLTSTYLRTARYGYSDMLPGPSGCAGSA
jgi:hypothetical protein